MRTTDFAVLLATDFRRVLNTNDLQLAGQGFCCGTPFLARASRLSGARHVLIIDWLSNDLENAPGFVSGTIGIPRGGRTSGLQAGDVRGPRRGRRARYRAGCDAQADRELRGKAVGRVTDVVSAHSSEYDPRSFPSPASQIHVDYATLGLWAKR